MSLEKVLNQIKDIAEGVVREEAVAVDREAWWPEKSMRTFQREGLGGFVVPKESGGLGQGLYGLAQACETIGQESASTGLCFGMHCVG